MDSVEVLKKVRKAIKEKAIMEAIVKIAQVNAETQKEELIVDIEGVRGIIPLEEIDFEFSFKSLIAFVGTNVRFVPLSITRDKTVICSRAAAQKIVAPIIIEKLADGECFDGTIINILTYGAYISIDGVVGLLKNVDFAEDYTSIKDRHHVGDKLSVKMKGNSKNGKLLLESVKKYVSPNVISKESLAAGQIVFGVVRNVQPWGVFVNIAPNLDALVDSDIPDIAEDQKVSIRIKSVKQDEDRFKVRGKIVSAL